ncbi:hypothetical protein [Providencia sp. Me31A]|uniref:hypothetical protein n=1 Tax=Providencia sp. Me31A TaxID=3392637 RepID=UPI003D28B156
MQRSVLLFFVILFMQPLNLYANENIKGRLFFQVAATDMNCKLEYDKYILINTKNYFDSPVLATFGYGIDANDIFKSGKNEIKLIVTPVDKPEAPDADRRYCEIRLSGLLKKEGKEFEFSIPFIVRLDKVGTPFSVNKSLMDFPDYDKEEKNNITVNHKKDGTIESIILDKSINVNFK